MSRGLGDVYKRQVPRNKAGVYPVTLLLKLIAETVNFALGSLDRVAVFTSALSEVSPSQIWPLIDAACPAVAPKIISAKTNKHAYAL